MLLTLLGRVTFLREEQPLNAHLPIFVTLLGRVMLVREEQLLNAQSAISSAEGIATVLRFEQFLKTSSGMRTSLSLKATLVSDLLSAKISSAITAVSG